MPNHNGRVGIFGISYVGFFTAAGIIDTHPAIKAASPQAPVADLFLGDDWYHGGAFMLAHAFNSAHAYQPQSGPTRPPKVEVPFDWGTEDGYEFFLELGPLRNLTARLGAPNPTWHELLAHPTYDEFWQSRAIWRHLAEHPLPGPRGRWLVRCRGPVGTAARLPRDQGRAIPASPTTPRDGPVDARRLGRDDGRRLGSVDFATDTAAFYREHILLPFFEHHLKDAARPAICRARSSSRPARMSGGGMRRGRPPGAQARTLYFREQGGLSFEPPADADAERHIRQRSREAGAVASATRR